MGQIRNAHNPLRNAYASRAMMNHFVLANYYDDGSDYMDSDSDGTPDIYNWSDHVDPSGYYNAIGTANSNVNTQVLQWSDVEWASDTEAGEPVPNAKILIERDAFSYEEGTTQTQGHTGYQSVQKQQTMKVTSLLRTLRKNTVSAFYGSVDESGPRAQIESGAFDMLSDITETARGRSHDQPHLSHFGWSSWNHIPRS